MLLQIFLGSWKKDMVYDGMEVATEEIRVVLAAWDSVLDFHPLTRD